MVSSGSTLLRFMRAIASGDAIAASRLPAASPSLAVARLEHGATRRMSTEYYLDEIGQYMYAGDTALHIVAASYRPELAQALVSAGADVSATNRRGAQPLHYAADGIPGAAGWNPHAQAATIAYLIKVGARSQCH